MSSSATEGAPVDACCSVPVDRPDGADNPSLGLLDMPGPWLKALVAGLCPDLLGLVTTCKAVRDLIKAHHHVSVEFRAPIKNPDHAQAQLSSALQGLSQWSTAEVAFSSRDNDAYEEEDTAKARKLLEGAVAAGHGVGSIASVYLHGMVLDALVPAWLTSACPNLRRLKLYFCTIQPPQVPQPPQPPPPLPSAPATHGGGVDQALTATSPTTTSPTTASASAPPNSAAQGDPQQHHHPTSPTTASPSSPPLTPLTHLLLIQMFLPDHEPTLLQWQQQLAALPNLTSLTLKGLPAPKPRFLEAIAAAVGSQLTQLCIEDLDESVQLQPHIRDLFPHLRDLQLAGTEIDDAGMEVLLGMGTLRKLLCQGFRLQRSYSHRPCPWTQLAVHELDIKSFDRLPMEGVHFTDQVLGHECDRVTDALIRTQTHTVVVSRDTPTEALIERVAAAVRAHGGTLWAGRDLELVRKRTGVNNPDSSQDKQAEAECLAAHMPIFFSCRNVERFTLIGARAVSNDLLATMRRYLMHAPSLKCIRFRAGKVLNESWPLLLAYMPMNVDHVVLELTVTEHQATRVCVGAVRPVRLEVYLHQNKRWKEGWRERIQKAMEDAGHQYVDLS